jgi:3',5'-cyclic AMP phosphodiesterase CpdA
VKIVHISDTHGRHAELDGKMPSGDVLVCTGDFTYFAEGGAAFLDWFVRQPCCLPGLLQFCPTDIRSPRSIVLNDLRSLSELVGAPPIGHRRIFGAGHFLFLREILSYDF